MPLHLDSDPRLQPQARESGRCVATRFPVDDMCLTAKERSLQAIVSIPFATETRD